MDAVVGAPFSHSTFAYFEAVTGQGHRSAATGGHGYYRDLYEPDTPDSRALTSALLIVLESSYVTPWDFPIPGDRHDIDGSVGHSIPELNMTLDWRWSQLANTYSDLLDEIANSPETLSELDLPVTLEGTATLQAMVADLITATEMRLPLVSGGDWMHGYRRLAALLARDIGFTAAELDHLIGSGGLLSAGLGAYNKVCGIAVSDADLEIFADLRGQPQIRRYATDFVRTLSEAGSIDQLWDSMRVAVESSDLARSVSETFGAAGTALGAVSLIPGLGSITGALGLAASGASMVADKRAEKSNWFALGPEILRAVSDAELRRFLDP